MILDRNSSNLSTLSTSRCHTKKAPWSTTSRPQGHFLSTNWWHFWLGSLYRAAATLSGPFRLGYAITMDNPTMAKLLGCQNLKDLLRLYLGNTFWACACVICCMFWRKTRATYISPSAQWTVKVFGRVPGIDRKVPSRNVLTATVLPVLTTSAMIGN